MGGQRTRAAAVYRIVAVLSVGIALGIPFGGSATAASRSADSVRTAAAVTIAPHYQAFTFIPARGAESVMMGAAGMVGRPVANAPRITSPSDGDLVDKHEPAVETHETLVTWATVAGVSRHLVSLTDATTGRPVVSGQDVGQGTEYAVPDAMVRYGHAYTFTVVAVTPRVSTSATVHFAVRVLPEMDDPVDIQLDGGTIVWNRCTPELLSSRDAFVQELSARGWSIVYASAARTLRYQEHLYLSATAGSDPALSAADRALLAAERNRHGLGMTVARPSMIDTHVRGDAFDARIFDAHGQPLNGGSWRDSRIESMADAAGLRMLPYSLNDSVHFQIQR
jgi:hypothetical protein